MDYVGHIFRPPSEARSLLLQVTIGCSHNRCAYCAMYRLPEQRFRAKSWKVIDHDIDEAASSMAAGQSIQRVFLCDGDALILSTRKLERILTTLRDKIPSVRRVGIYGDARSILRKTEDELSRLRELGLGIVYHGVESGDPVVLSRINKGSSAEETVASALRLRAAGIRHSVIIMLGLGGTERSRLHAEATANLLSEMDPPYVGALTTMLIPGTALHDEASQGRFDLPDRWGMLAELETIITGSRFTRCRFHANHASNYLPLSLNLPTDRERALTLLREVIRTRENSRLTPEYLRGL
ncbi:MAG: radical SAM protein [bacterium]